MAGLEYLILENNIDGRRIADDIVQINEYVSDLQNMLEEQRRVSLTIGPDVSMSKT